MPRHPVPKTNLLSTTCKRCQWFQSKTTAKEKGYKVSTNAFGRCTMYDGGGELYDRPVPAGPVPCYHFRFKPCTVGNSYAVMNTRTMHISFITPIKVEAKVRAERANNPDIIAIELSKVK